MSTSAPTTASSPSAPTTAEEKSSPTINKRSRIGFFAGGIVLGGVTGLALGPLGFPDWVKGWTLSDLDMSVIAQPLATVASAFGVIVAARIAFRNGEKNRNQEKKHQEEAAKRETERSLRDRFFKITETLSEGSEYVKREAGVYALIALADDWAAFHRDDPDAAQREQQTCLNVITGQLRDPLSADSSQAHSDSETAESAQQKKEQPQDDLGLLIFKHRVQEILWERFRPSDGAETGPWSHLDLDLSNCHLHDSDSGLVQFRGSTSFSGAEFHGHTSFRGAQFRYSTSFFGVQFRGSTFFHKAEFHGHTFFSGVQFRGSVAFDEAEFYGSASFDEVEFRGSTSFRGAQFHGSVDFDEAEFRYSTSFFAVQFRYSTSFIGAQFHGHTFFIGAQFHGSADFDEAEFYGSATFHKTHLHGHTSFNRAQFHGSILFDQTYFCSSFTWDKATQDEGQITFKNVHFRAEKSTVLQEIDAGNHHKIVENAVFSAGCPFDSWQSSE